MDNEKFQELVLQQFNKVFEKFESLDRGQQKLELRMESVEKGQQRLETRLGAVEKGQQRLETRMENEVIDKIRALFDGRQVQHEKLLQFEDKLESIEIDTGYLVSRVAKVEKLVK